MKCLVLFSGKNKKNILNFLSAELSQRVLKVIILVWVFVDRARTEAVCLATVFFSKICCEVSLILKALITTAADDILILILFSENRLDISCEWSANNSCEIPSFIFSKK